MKVKTKEFENGQAVLSIEVEPPEMEESLAAAYRHLAKELNIPGFRKGKIPRSVLENYVGREGLQQEALEHLIPQLCDQAVEEHKLAVIAQPQAEVLEWEPVVFKATFPLRPTIELGDYRSIRIAPEPIEVTDEDTGNAIERLHDQNAVWVPVERPVQFGDMVTADIEQKQVSGAPTSYTGQQLPVVQGSPLPLPGFAEQLEGMEKDQEKEFTISFPEDHEIAELAGQEYNFKVKLTEIKEKNLPDLNDEFAKSVGYDVETLDGLREVVGARLKTAAEARARSEFEEKVLERLVGMSKVEFPPILVEREIDQMLAERDRMFRSQGGLEAYLASMGKTEEDVRQELQPRAVEQLARALVLGKLVEEEKIEVSAAEIDAEIDRMVKDAGDTAEEVRDVFGTPQGRRWVSDRLMSRNAIQRLTDIALGDTGQPDTAEEPAEAPADEEGAD